MFHKAKATQSNVTLIRCEDRVFSVHTYRHRGVDHLEIRYLRGRQFDKVTIEKLPTKKR